MQALKRSQPDGNRAKVRSNLPLHPFQSLFYVMTIYCFPHTIYADLVTRIIDVSQVV
ncbi:hypothetical protein L210DRAFT_939844 [Boletus edulis BED1]|uniref:Uncharacterized protein n=1 Tax=Boletus edulis BED1 TaxID=1328754 RepID=A0AAD4C0J2_BOLED|nr:hypothetical protein L210DRAFT_939844 [Boletus edulis BED1]